MNEIAARIEGCQLSRIGAVFPPNITLEQWNEIGDKLHKMGDAIQFWIGDWFLHGEKTFSLEQLERAECLKKFSYKTLYKAVNVCRAVDPSDRREGVDLFHHAEVSALKPEDQRHWLEMAAKHNLTPLELRLSIAAGKVLTKDEVQSAAPKTGGIVSLVSLSRKLRSWEKSAQDIDTMELQDLMEANESLKPFVALHEKVEKRLGELNGTRKG